MSLSYNISTYNNTTFSLVVEWETYSGSSSGSATPVNLAGYTSIMQVRQYAGSPTALFSVGSFPASGLLLNTPSTGSISISISPTNYVGIGTGTFYYDLLCVDPLGNQYVILYGEYVLNPGVSQSSSFVSVSNPIPVAAVENLTVLSNLTSEGLTTLTSVIASSGTIDNTVIGGIEPASGTFTVVNASNVNSIDGDFTTVATQNLSITSNATTTTPASGSDGLTIPNTAWTQNLVAPIATTAQNAIPKNSPIVITGQTTATSATAGTASTLPSLPKGYLEITLNGVAVKIPYYAV